LAHFEEGSLDTAAQDEILKKVVSERNMSMSRTMASVSKFLAPAPKDVP